MIKFSSITGGRHNRNRIVVEFTTVQSVLITTKVVSSNPTHGVVYSIKDYVIKFVNDLPQVVVFSMYSCLFHQ